MVRRIWEILSESNFTEQIQIVSDFFLQRQDAILVKSSYLCDGWLVHTDNICAYAIYYNIFIFVCQYLSFKKGSVGSWEALGAGYVTHFSPCGTDNTPKIPLENTPVKLWEALYALFSEKRPRCTGYVEKMPSRYLVLANSKICPHKTNFKIVEICQGGYNTITPNPSFPLWAFRWKV